MNFATILRHEGRKYSFNIENDSVNNMIQTAFSNAYTKQGEST